MFSSVHIYCCTYLHTLTCIMLYTPCLFPYFSVRAYDLLLFLLSFLFLAYLLVLLVPTVKKLHGSIPLFRLLYCMVSIVLLVSHWVLHMYISVSLVHCFRMLASLEYVYKLSYLRITTFLTKCPSNIVAGVPWYLHPLSPTYHSNQCYFTGVGLIATCYIGVQCMYGVSLCSV